MKVSLCLATSLALVLLSSCATTSRYEAKVHSWEGKSADVLTTNWGPPDDIERLSNGDKMLVYARLHHDPVAYWQAQRTIASIQSAKPARNPASVKAAAKGARAPASTVYIECATYFEVNPQNIIVASQFRGDECKSKD